MIVNSQSKGAVSGSPEEGLQLMKRVRLGGPHVGKNQLFGLLGGTPKLKAKGLGFAIPPSRMDQNGPHGTSKPGKTCYIWGLFSEIHCPLPMIGVLS